MVMRWGGMNHDVNLVRLIWISSERLNGVQFCEERVVQVRVEGFIKRGTYVT